MKGFLKLYAFNQKILITGFYESVDERRMLIRAWGERFAPLGYYFVITPVVIDGVWLNQRYKKVKEKKIKVVMEEKARVVFKRPKAEYGNKSPYGIADEIHK